MPLLLKQVSAPPPRSRMSLEAQMMAARSLRSRTMAAVPSERTSLEQMLARELWMLGLRGWRRHKQIAGTRPDFAFLGRRLVIFVDGCFWHGCPICEKRPATNTDYWDAKLSRNSRRDADQTAALREAGWNVVRFWGHELESSALRCALEVQDLLRD